MYNVKLASGFPDGIFSEQKQHSGQILDCFAIGDVGIHIL
jgi:hypothetical protein